MKILIVYNTLIEKVLNMSEIENSYILKHLKQFLGLCEKIQIKRSEYFLN
jgi:hypothetical protein